MCNLWQLALRNGREKRYSKNTWKRFVIKIKEMSEKLYDLIRVNSSVIGQKGEFQNECCKKTKQVKSSEKQIFLTP